MDDREQSPHNEPSTFPHNSFNLFWSPVVQLWEKPGLLWQTSTFPGRNTQTHPPHNIPLQFCKFLPLTFCTWLISNWQEDFDSNSLKCSGPDAPETPECCCCACTVKSFSQTSSGLYIWMGLSTHIEHLIHDESTLISGSTLLDGEELDKAVSCGQEFLPADNADKWSFSNGFEKSPDDRPLNSLRFTSFPSPFIELWCCWFSSIITSQGGPDSRKLKLCSKFPLTDWKATKGSWEIDIRLLEFSLDPPTPANCEVLKSWPNWECPSMISFSVIRVSSSASPDDSDTNFCASKSEPQLQFCCVSFPSLYQPLPLASASGKLLIRSNDGSGEAHRLYKEFRICSNLTVPLPDSGHCCAAKTAPTIPSSVTDAGRADDLN